MDRQLTSGERELMQAPLNEYWVKRDGLLPKEARAFEAGFTAGLDTAAEQVADLTAKIAAQEDALGSCCEAFEGLEAELDGLRAAHQELSRLAREVSRNYSGTSWNIGAIRRLTQYIDDKDKESLK